MNQRESIPTPPLGVLAVILFAAGLFVSFGIAGSLGFAPTVFWPMLVMLFFLAVFFLGKPKLYLMFLFLYFGFFYNGVFLGIYPVHLPLLRLFDDFLILVPIAVIVMRAIQRTLPARATLFPLFYLGLSVLSYKVNHVPALNALRVCLAFGKFYIFWYFARTAAPWSDREKKRAFLLYILFSCLQFPLNVLWQKGITLRYADVGTGTIGNAHLVGYVSAFALFLLFGFLKTWPGHPRLRTVICTLLATLIISYNMIFLTDTKHILLMIPWAGLPFVLWPGWTTRIRALLLVTGLTIALASVAYLSRAGVTARLSPGDYFRAVEYSGKGYIFHVLTDVLPKELPVPLLGAGPGNFCSSVATESMRPLAVQHVLPFIIMAYRSRGSATESSILGTPRTSLFTLWGEFGLPCLLLYLWFCAHVMVELWKKSLRPETSPFSSGQQIALIPCLLLLVLLGALAEIFTLGILMIPIWTMIGIYWDTPPAGPAPATAQPAPPGQADRPGRPDTPRPARRTVRP